jgi:hypothetical protein
LIYFLQAVTGGPVKIGTAVNVDRRLAQLESHYGQPLAVLATMEGGPDEEREIHARFAHLRFERQGRRGRRPEQFRPAAELMEFIGRPLLVGPNPDAVEAIEPRHVRDTNPIRLDLPLDIHHLLRKVAADENVSMAAYARDHIAKHLKEEAKRRGIR